MDFIVGILVGLVTCIFARVVGFDRDRAFYPTVLVVIALYYVLFAVMGGSTRALVLELVAMTAFVLMAIAGFKRNLLLVVVAFAAHGVFDFFHTDIVYNQGMPAWWPAFCMACDVAMGAFLVWLLLGGGRARLSSSVREPHAGTA
jgi:uncharacterized membrane protein